MFHLDKIIFHSFPHLFCNYLDIEVLEFVKLLTQCSRASNIQISTLDIEIIGYSCDL